MLSKDNRGLRANSWGILLYTLMTSNMTISVSSSTPLGHLIKKSKLSQIKLLMCFNKGFDSISVN